MNEHHNLWALSDVRSMPDVFERYATTEEANARQVALYVRTALLDPLRAGVSASAVRELATRAANHALEALRMRDLLAQARQDPHA